MKFKPRREGSYVIKSAEGGYRPITRRDAGVPEGDQKIQQRCCVTCGAVITGGTTRMHNEWHDRLAVELAKAD